MIAVKLKGGLGNQMFQYALGKKLALKHNTGLILDISHYKNIPQGETPREFELGHFRIGRDVVVCEALENTGYKKLFRKEIKFQLIYEKSLAYDSSVLNLPDNCLLEGHWITEKYFLDIRELLLKNFDLSHSLSVYSASQRDIIQQGPSVSMHIRRGDYISNLKANEFHGTKDVSYYINGLDKINKLQPAHYTVYIFSDDIEWCKKNIKTGFRTKFIDGESSAQEDMFLMSLCSHNIVANSTFSWWGAWLNNNPEKIVIAPKIWLNDKSVDTSDIVPDSWIKI